MSSAVLTITVSYYGILQPGTGWLYILTAPFIANKEIRISLLIYLVANVNNMQEYEHVVS